MPQHTDIPVFELRRIHGLALDAMQRGVDLQRINARVKTVTGLANFAELDKHLNPEPLAEFADAPGNEFSDFGRAAAQGATFGFADELVAAMKMKTAAAPGRGLVGIETPESEAALEASRERISTLRETSPGSTLLSEIAGGAVTPGVGVLGAGARSQSVLGTLGRAAATSGALGGLYGAGEAEGSLSERLPGAATGAAIGSLGGVLGAGIGAGGRVTREFFRGAPGPRVAQTLRQAGGIESLPALREAAERNVREVAGSVFGPLERQFPRVNNQTFLNALKRPEIAPYVKAVAPKVASGKRTPTFREMQEIGQAIQNDLARVSRAGKPAQFERMSRAADEYMELAEKAVPGYRDARRAYAQAIEEQEVLGVFPGGKTRSPEGVKFAGKASPAELKARLAELSTDRARDALRASTIEEMAKTLEQQAKLPQKFTDLTPAFREKIRVMYPNRRAAARVADQLIQEAQAVKARKLAGAAALATFGYGALQWARGFGLFEGR